LGTSDLLEAFGITAANPMLLAGMLLGALGACLFTALAAGGSGRAAVRLADECRRQWRMIPGLSALKRRPGRTRSGPSAWPPNG